MLGLIIMLYLESHVGTNEEVDECHQTKHAQSRHKKTCEHTHTHTHHHTHTHTSPHITQLNLTMKAYIVTKNLRTPPLSPSPLKKFLNETLAVISDHKSHTHSPPRYKKDLFSLKRAAKEKEANITQVPRKAVGTIL